MIPDGEQDHLVLGAVGGDGVALKLLLVQSSPALRKMIDRRIRGNLRRTLDAEDVLQQADIEVFRRLGQFDGRSYDAFIRWRCALALSRLRNAIRNHGAAKRVGQQNTATNEIRRSVDESTVALLKLIPGRDKTPSRWLARAEAVELIQQALEQLPPRQRQAVALVHIEGQAVRDAAALLECSERAIHGLCRRGLAVLGERLDKIGASLDSRS